MLKTTILTILCLSFCLFLIAEEFPIATGNFSQTYPEIAFDGDNYYVAFVDRRGGPNSYAFYARFVTPEGSVPAGETELVPAHNAMSFMHHLARGTDDYLFVWSRQRGPYDYLRDTYARLLDEDGLPTGNSFQVSIGNSESAAFIRTAFDGENYLVIWQEGMPTQGAHLRGQFVSSNGSLIGQNFSIRPPDLPADTAQIYPDLVFDGSNYFVTWDDSRTGSRSVYGQFVSPEGDFIGDNIVITTEAVDQMLVKLAFNGSRFFVVWADGRDNPNNKSVYGQLLDINGELVGNQIPISIVVGNIERSWPAVGSNGNQFFVAWRQDIYRGNLPVSFTPENRVRSAAAGLEEENRQQLWYNIHGRIINADGSFATDEFPVCTELYHQHEPAIASDMEDFLVAWMDSRNQNQYYDIYGMIVEGESAPDYNPPRNLQAESININEIYLVWDEPLLSDIDISSYHIYEDGELLEVIEDPQTHEYQTTGRDSGEYSYYVTAVYDDDAESLPSNQVEVTVYLLPPLDFHAQLENSDVVCTWNSPASLRELTSFRLYRNDILLIETGETQYTDTEPETGENYYYLTAVYDNLYESVSTDTIDVYVTYVSDADHLPPMTSLKQNIPNPFNPATKINYELAEPGQVRIAVYDLKGRRIRTLVDKLQPAGIHQIIWNGKNDHGKSVTSGIYLYRIVTENYQATRKMLLLK